VREHELGRPGTAPTSEAIHEPREHRDEERLLLGLRRRGVTASPERAAELRFGPEHALDSPRVEPVLRQPTPVAAELPGDLELLLELEQIRRARRGRALTTPFAEVGARRAADVAFREQRDEARRAQPHAPALAFVQNAREPWMERQLEQPATDRGEAAATVRRAEEAEQIVGAFDRGGRGRIEPGELGRLGVEAVE